MNATCIPIAHDLNSKIYDFFLSDWVYKGSQLGSKHDFAEKLHPPVTAVVAYQDTD